MDIRRRIRERQVPDRGEIRLTLRPVPGSQPAGPDKWQMNVTASLPAIPECAKRNFGQSDWHAGECAAMASLCRRLVLSGTKQRRSRTGAVFDQSPASAGAVGH